MWEFSVKGQKHNNYVDECNPNQLYAVSDRLLVLKHMCLVIYNNNSKYCMKGMNINGHNNIWICMMVILFQYTANPLYNKPCNKFPNKK